jgi:uncharacterized protein HemY
MSRAIQRILKDYRKAEKLVGRLTNEPLVDLTNATSFTSQTYAQTMAQIRREPELTQDEKKYLVAVERKLKHDLSIIKSKTSNLDF